MSGRWKPKSQEEIQGEINALLNNEKFRNLLEQHEAEWREKYSANQIANNDFSKTYSVPPQWTPAIRQLLGLKIVSPFKIKKEGKMEERKNNQEVAGQNQQGGLQASQQGSQPAITKEEVKELVNKTIRELARETQVSQPPPPPTPPPQVEVKPVITREEVKEVIKEGILELEKQKQAEAEAKRKAEEEEAKKLAGIKEATKKEVAQQIVDHCKLHPDDPFCKIHKVDISKPDEVIKLASDGLKYMSEMSPIPAPKLRGQILRESVAGSPERVAEIFAEVSQNNPEAVKRFFETCASGKCEFPEDIKKMLRTKQPEEVKAEEKKEEAKTEEKKGEVKTAKKPEEMKLTGFDRLRGYHKT